MIQGSNPKLAVQQGLLGLASTTLLSSGTLFPALSASGLPVMCYIQNYLGSSSSQVVLPGARMPHSQKRSCHSLASLRLCSEPCILGLYFEVHLSRVTAFGEGDSKAEHKCYKKEALGGTGLRATHV